MQYYLVYKPFNYLSQFTKEVPDHLTLSDLHTFPPAVYPVGRLDKDSEGLLILTNDKKLNGLLLNPKQQHRRTYWVQVEGLPDKAAIQQLREGVSIRINKKDYQTLPTEARILKTKPELPLRNPPIRVRKTVPDSWIEITLTEGKNRQVRRMCAKVGLPVLRLVRVQIENILLDDMQPGDVRVVNQAFIYKKLKIKG